MKLKLIDNVLNRKNWERFCYILLPLTYKNIFVIFFVKHIVLQNGSNWHFVGILVLLWSNYKINLVKENKAINKNIKYNGTLLKLNIIWRLCYVHQTSMTTNCACCEWMKWACSYFKPLLTHVLDTFSSHSSTCLFVNQNKNELYIDCVGFNSIIHVSTSSFVM